jgi:hypothetical protein
MPDPTPQDRTAPREHTFTRDQLTDALTRLDVRVLISGPAAGLINAESMADCIIEALETERRRAFRASLRTPLE